MPRLLVIKGFDEGKQFDLADALISIGRDASNVIRLHDTEVSRRHAEFLLVDGGYRVVDKGSVNGTFVNEKRVTHADLQSGDKVLIGQTTLLYNLGRNDRTEVGSSSNLAEQISMITREDVELRSAIVKTIGEAAGSRILTNPAKNSPWLQGALANLSIMYEASQAVSHILDLDELLQRILELIFRSINADRGCILLGQGEANALEPKAIHWRPGVEVEEKLQVSRTIIDYVLTEKKGVLANDAAGDDRFKAGQSIVRYGIREVICVPMKGRHETLGVLYLDTHTQAKVNVERTSMGKFTEDHLALAIAIAHQAALAIEETRYHQALLQAERLAAIGQTIAALSHHIKNILQGLRSGSEIIKMGLNEKNDHLIQQGWRVAEKNQGKIYNLVMDMLSYSKEREPAVEPTQVNEIVQDVADLLGPRAKEMNVQFEVSLATNLPIIPVDPDGLNRALLNVVGNALDAVEERPEPKVTVGTRSTNDGLVRIIVLDNGMGIAPDEIEDMFKPFVSTKGARGTGLGLPVSRKILREHGGDILVQSQEGVGSKFILQLPIKSPFDGSQSAEFPAAPPEAN